LLTDETNDNETDFSGIWSGKTRILAFHNNHLARDMPEEKTIRDNFNLLNFIPIKSIVEITAGKIRSAVSVFFTGCKRLDRRHQASEDRGRWPDGWKQKMRSRAAGK